MWKKNYKLYICDSITNMFFKVESQNIFEQLGLQYLIVWIFKKIHLKFGKLVQKNAARQSTVGTDNNKPQILTALVEFSPLAPENHLTKLKLLSP